MTPDQRWRLEKIQAHVQERLQKASGRTPGVFDVLPDRDDSGWAVRNDSSMQLANCIREGDARFITDCVNNAEPGWRNTIATIEFLLLADETNRELPFGHLLEDTLSAWNHILP
jgi:hypothetical protein